MAIKKKKNPFKPGDKVRRTHVDTDTIKVGDIDIVKSAASIFTIKLEGHGDVNYDISRFELVEEEATVTDEIEVELNYSEALQFLEKYPNSEYLKPAMDAIKGLPAVPFCLGEIDPWTLPEDSIFTLWDTVRVRRHANDSNYVGHDYVVTPPHAGAGKDGFHPNSAVAKSSTVIFVPEGSAKTPATVKFKMPVEVARKIGGCTLPPLVAAWDKAHPKKSPFLVWLEEFGVGRAFRISHAGPAAQNARSFLYIKIYNEIVQYNSSGQFNRSFSLEGFDCYMVDIKPTDIFVL